MDVESDYDRSRKWAGEIPSADLPDNHGSDLADLVAGQVSVAAALLRLPARQRAVLAWRYFADLTEAQSAYAMGCRVGPELIDPRAIRATNRPRRSHRRWVRAPVAAVAVVVTIVVAALVITRNRDGNTSAPRTTAATNALTRSTHLGVTLTYPASWRLAPVTFINAGLVYPIDYITNEPLVSECRAGCGPPVEVLTPGGVIITLNDGPDFAFGYEHTANTTVAGRPAHVTITKGDCPPGGTISTQAQISLSRAGTNERMLDIEACADDPTGRVQAAINQMLKTATFKAR